MIKLIEQFQIIIISFFIGFIGSFLWNYLYDLFLKKRKIIIKAILSLLFFISLSVASFYLLFITTDAYITFYIPTFMILGMAIYFLIYYEYVARNIKNLSKKIEKIRLKIYNQFSKKKKRWKYGIGRKSKKKSLEYSKN